jgi:hypothetical protein
LDKEDAPVKDDEGLMFLLHLAALVVVALGVRLYSGDSLFNDTTLPYIGFYFAAVFGIEAIGKLHAILEAIKDNNGK